MPKYLLRLIRLAVFAGSVFLCFMAIGGCGDGDSGKSIDPDEGSEVFEE